MAKTSNSSHPLPSEVQDNVDDDLPPVARADDSENEKGHDSNPMSGPLVVSSDVLMGKMPKQEKVMKDGVVGKLTSSYEWKPMHMVLTSVGLFFSRPGEDVLRDLIPLFEVLDIRKRHDSPTEDSANDQKGFIQGQGSMRGMKMASLMSEGSQDTSTPQNIIQIRTVDTGYNSGRTYYLRIETADACNDWVNQLRTAAERALMLKQAGPSFLHKIRLHVRHLYSSTVVQGIVAVLIFFSFVVNIVQVLFPMHIYHSLLDCSGEKPKPLTTPHPYTLQPTQSHPLLTCLNSVAMDWAQPARSSDPRTTATV